MTELEFCYEFLWVIQRFTASKAAPFIKLFVLGHLGLYLFSRDSCALKFISNGVTS